jgi:hypothetical protein
MGKSWSEEFLAAKAEIEDERRRRAPRMLYLPRTLQSNYFTGLTSEC